MTGTQRKLEFCERTGALLEQGGLFLPKSKAVIPISRNSELEILQEIRHKGVSRSRLQEELAQFPAAERLEIQCDLERFLSQGILIETLSHNEVDLVSRRRFSTNLGLQSVEYSDAELSLSPFSFLRPQGNELLLESPLIRASVRLMHNKAKALVAKWTGGSSPLSPANEEMEQSIETFLMELGFLVTAGELEKPDEEPTGGLAAWEFQDLLFHSRSRFGGHPLPELFRFRHLKRAPDLDPTESGVKSYPLAKVTSEIEALKYCEVLHARQTKKERRERILNLEELGQFLYLSARAIPRVDGIPGHRRLAASATALNVFVAAQEVEDLPPGLYRYDPFNHRLSLFKNKEKGLDEIQTLAFRSMGGDEPCALLLITVSLEDVFWKYSGSGWAYSLILKYVGALYQTMYLAATALKLHACAIGSGSSAMFADFTGLPEAKEALVGEFSLR